ncbi:ROK family protein [Mumia sp. zg.B53]|uniref:ROK family transcriptional regulator n=1 Tax=unclassified Mumia TaxID=2621872 RepID=UPI001C6F569C|nr:MULTISPECIES: ROK family transcriptional regulator [unclassified Mumia]MBW9205270.1 ROK family protein [Mumia sp. zg.B17]MBW9208731.1 ROK family protein [Mumia sp. zg.B21]MBW9213342.1 ROK family protein [Mumia sp. zg.B53]
MPLQQQRPTGKGANQEAVRRHNLGTLLGHVHRDGDVSRADLTTRMGLNRSTIAALVGELERLGVVAQATPGGDRQGAGRPSLHVRPGERQVCVVAVELRVESIELARVGLGGAVLDRASSPLAPQVTPEAVAEQVARTTAELLVDVPDDALLVGVGVGIPGIVSTEDGRIHYAPNLQWRDVPFGDLLQQRIGGRVPVVIGNDANLGVLAEHTRGVARGMSDVVYLAGDVGVGAGLITRGRGLFGTVGYAGEVGHMRISSDGRRCRCGNRGCWETEIGAVAVADALGTPSHDIAHLVSLLEEVRTPSLPLREVGYKLGVGITNLVNVFDPQAVILGGLLSALYPAVRADVDAELRHGTLDATDRRTEILLPGLGRDSVLVGAGELAFGAMMADPLLVSAEAESVVGRVRSTISV